MAIIASMARVGPKPPKEIIKAAKKVAREAKRHPEEYDSECPPSTPEALAEFAALRAAQKKKDIRPVVALRLMPDVLAKYKALGKGYTGIMADVLSYVADNPEILSKVH
ncbi:MAG: BrnA antitoxin family protein [Treponema sp.]|jgi:uncharacterized protein (DUF4415 family)|nr:BrnA antitoxin family protein [Treponema sp.]